MMCTLWRFSGEEEFRLPPPHPRSKLFSYQNCCFTLRREKNKLDPSQPLLSYQRPRSLSGFSCLATLLTRPLLLAAIQSLTFGKYGESVLCGLRHQQLLDGNLGTSQLDLRLSGDV